MRRSDGLSVAVETVDVFGVELFNHFPCKLLPHLHPGAATPETLMGHSVSIHCGQVNSVADKVWGYWR